MRYLRTASTRRLLVTICGALGAAAACAAIAVAATGAGPIPRPTTLSGGIHAALSAGTQHPVTGVSADITFTDNLIDSTDLTGHTVDPLLQGASGRLWWTSGGRFRLELQSDDGDAQIVVDQRSWWISDPVQNVVFEGTLPASKGSSGSSGAGSHGSGDGDGDGVPTIASIQTELAQLMQRFNITGPTSTDVGGRPAYRVTVSPKTSAGLLGSVQLAWDASRGIPLQFDVYARGSATPVLGLQATSVSYGAVPASVFDISPPAGAHIVPVGGSGSGTTAMGSHEHHGPAITGLQHVAAHVSFALHPAASVNGLKLRKVELNGRDAALLLYGHGLGTIAAIESPASGASSQSSSLDGLSLPTHTVDGATATVLSTPLGTVLRFTKGGVAYTVVGSVTATGAESAAGVLAAGG
jgi:outer membrane lipoprotein-sorting protein